MGIMAAGRVEGYIMKTYVVEKHGDTAVITLNEKLDWSGFNEFVENIVPEEWCVAETIIVDLSNLRSISSIEAIIFHRILSQRKSLKVVATGPALEMMRSIDMQGITIYPTRDEALTS